MGVAAMAGMAAVGTAVQVHGNNMETDQKMEALQREADIKEREAQEVIKRFEINKQLITKRAEAVKADISGIATKAGAGGGGLLMALEDTDRTLREEIYKMQEEANYRALMFRTSAESDIIASQQVEGANRINNAATILGGGAMMAGAAAR